MVGERRSLTWAFPSSVSYRLRPPRGPAWTASFPICGEGPDRPDVLMGLDDGLVSRIFASWNQLDGWLRQLEALRST